MKDVGVGVTDVTRFDKRRVNRARKWKMQYRIKIQRFYLC
jgi:hypothetical protein